MKNEDLEKAERQFDLFLNGKLSPPEQEELDKSVETFKLEREEPLVFSSADSARMLKNIHKAAGIPSPSRSITWFRMAAVILTATAGFMITWYVLKSPPQVSDKLILNDGTLVWLKEGSALDYPKQFDDNTREVTLRGEALFEVAKDHTKPFLIHCGQFVASVVGTSFNLKTKENQVELTVLTGKVRLTSISRDSSVVVGSNEHVVLSGTRGIIEKRVSDESDVREVLTNTQYNMMFEDTRMDDIIRRVEGKFDVKIHVENEEINNCMISADFTDQSLPVTLLMIAEALGVEYEIEDDEVSIKGPGCK